MVHATQQSARPKSPRRQRKREERTEQILQTAELLIAEQGLEALSLNAVAQRLDLVPAALYRYFRSKNDLVGALHRRIIEDLHQRFVAHQASHEPALAALAPQPRALGALLLACDFYLSLPRELPERFRFVSLMLGDPRQLIDDEDVPLSASALMSFLGDIRRLFDAAHDVGALSPARSLDRTLVLWSSLQGVLQLNKLRHYDEAVFDASRLAQLLVQPLLVGWGATPATLESAAKSLTID